MARLTEFHRQQRGRIRVNLEIKLLVGLKIYILGFSKIRIFLSLI
jgi:hypothetical protein